MPIWKINQNPTDYIMPIDVAHPDDFFTDLNIDDKGANAVYNRFAHNISYERPFSNRLDDYGRLNSTIDGIIAYNTAHGIATDRKLFSGKIAPDIIQKHALSNLSHFDITDSNSLYYKLSKNITNLSLMLDEENFGYYKLNQNVRKDIETSIVSKLLQMRSLDKDRADTEFLSDSAVQQALNSVLPTGWNIDDYYSIVQNQLNNTAVRNSTLDAKKMYAGVYALLQKAPNGISTMDEAVEFVEKASYNPAVYDSLISGIDFNDINISKMLEVIQKTHAVQRNKPGVSFNPAIPIAVNSIMPFLPEGQFISYLHMEDYVQNNANSGDALAWNSIVSGQSDFPITSSKNTDIEDPTSYAAHELYHSNSKYGLLKDYKSTAIEESLTASMQMLKSGLPVMENGYEHYAIEAIPTLKMLYPNVFKKVKTFEDFSKLLYEEEIRNGIISGSPNFKISQIPFLNDVSLKDVNTLSYAYTNKDKVGIDLQKLIPYAMEHHDELKKIFSLPMMGEYINSYKKGLTNAEDIFKSVLISPNLSGVPIDIFGIKKSLNDPQLSSYNIVLKNLLDNLVTGSTDDFYSLYARDYLYDKDFDEFSELKSEKSKIKFLKTHKIDDVSITPFSIDSIGDEDFIADVQKAYTASTFRKIILSEYQNNPEEFIDKIIKQSTSLTFYKNVIESYRKRKPKGMLNYDATYIGSLKDGPALYESKQYIKELIKAIDDGTFDENFLESSTQKYFNDNCFKYAGIKSGIFKGHVSNIKRDKFFDILREGSLDDLRDLSPMQSKIAAEKSAKATERFDRFNGLDSGEYIKNPQKILANRLNYVDLIEQLPNTSKRSLFESVGQIFNKGTYKGLIWTPEKKKQWIDYIKDPESLPKIQSDIDKIGNKGADVGRSPLFKMLYKYPANIPRVRDMLHENLPESVDRSVLDKALENILKQTVSPEANAAAVEPFNARNKDRLETTIPIIDSLTKINDSGERELTDYGKQLNKKYRDSFMYTVNNPKKDFMDRFYLGLTSLRAANEAFDMLSSNDELASLGLSTDMVKGVGTDTPYTYMTKDEKEKYDKAHEIQVSYPQKGKKPKYTGTLPVVPRPPIDNEKLFKETASTKLKKRASKTFGRLLSKASPIKQKSRSTYGDYIRNYVLKNLEERNEFARKTTGPQRDKYLASKEERANKIITQTAAKYDRLKGSKYRKYMLDRTKRLKTVEEELLKRSFDEKQLYSPKGDKLRYAFQRHLRKRYQPVYERNTALYSKPEKPVEKPTESETSFNDVGNYLTPNEIKSLESPDKQAVSTNSPQSDFQQPDANAANILAAMVMLDQKAKQQDYISRYKQYTNERDVRLREMNNRILTKEFDNVYADKIISQTASKYDTKRNTALYSKPEKPVEEPVKKPKQKNKRAQKNKYIDLFERKTKTLGGSSSFYPAFRKLMDIDTTKIIGDIKNDNDKTVKEFTKALKIHEAPVHGVPKKTTLTNSGLYGDFELPSRPLVKTDSRFSKPYNLTAALDSTGTPVNQPSIPELIMSSRFDEHSKSKTQPIITKHDSGYIVKAKGDYLIPHWQHKSRSRPDNVVYEQMPNTPLDLVGMPVVDLFDFSYGKTKTYEQMPIRNMLGQLDPKMVRMGAVNPYSSRPFENYSPSAWLSKVGRVKIHTGVFDKDGEITYSVDSLNRMNPENYSPEKIMRYKYGLMDTAYGSIDIPYLGKFISNDNSNLELNNTTLDLIYGFKELKKEIDSWTKDMKMLNAVHVPTTIAEKYQTSRKDLKELGYAREFRELPKDLNRDWTVEEFIDNSNSWIKDILRNAVDDTSINGFERGKLLLGQAIDRVKTVNGFEPMAKVVSVDGLVEDNQSLLALPESKVAQEIVQPVAQEIAQPVTQEAIKETPKAVDKFFKPIVNNTAQPVAQEIAQPVTQEIVKTIADGPYVSSNKPKAAQDWAAGNPMYDLGVRLIKRRLTHQAADEIYDTVNKRNYQTDKDEPLVRQVFDKAIYETYSKHMSATKTGVVPYQAVKYDDLPQELKVLTGAYKQEQDLYAFLNTERGKAIVENVYSQFVNTDFDRLPYGIFEAKDEVPKIPKRYTFDTAVAAAKQRLAAKTEPINTGVHSLVDENGNEIAHLFTGMAMPLTDDLSVLNKKYGKRQSPLDKLRADALTMKPVATSQRSMFDLPEWQADYAGKYVQKPTVQEMMAKTSGMPNLTTLALPAPYDSAKGPWSYVAKYLSPSEKLQFRNTLLNDEVYLKNQSVFNQPYNYTKQQVDAAREVIKRRGERILMNMGKIADPYIEEEAQTNDLRKAFKTSNELNEPFNNKERLPGPDTFLGIDHFYELGEKTRDSYGRKMDSLLNASFSMHILNSYLYPVKYLLKNIFDGIVKIFSEYEKKYVDYAAKAKSVSSSSILSSKDLIMAANQEVYSANDIVTVAERYAASGINTSNSMDEMTYVIKAATIAQADYNTVANAAIKAQMAFGLQTKDTSMITDAWISAANASTAELGDMITGFQYVASSAKNAGLSVQDTAAYLAMLDSQGLANTATSFRQLLLTFRQPAKRQKFSALFGFTNEDFSDMNKVFQTVRDYVNDAPNESERNRRLLQISDALGGKVQGFDALQAYINISDEQMQMIMNAVSETGVTEKMYEEVTNNMTDKLAKLNTEMQASSLLMGQYISPIIQGFVTGLTKLVNVFNGLPGPIHAAIAALGAFGIAASGALALGTSTIAGGMTAASMLYRFKEGLLRNDMYDDNRVFNSFLNSDDIAYLSKSMPLSDVFTEEGRSSYNKKRSAQRAQFLLQKKGTTRRQNIFSGIKNMLILKELDTRSDLGLMSQVAADAYVESLLYGKGKGKGGKTATEKIFNLGGKLKSGLKPFVDFETAHAKWQMRPLFDKSYTKPGIMEKIGLGLSGLGMKGGSMTLFGQTVSTAAVGAAGVGIAGLLASTVAYNKAAEAMEKNNFKQAKSLALLGAVASEAAVAIGSAYLMMTPETAPLGVALLLGGSVYNAYKYNATKRDINEAQYKATAEQYAANGYGSKVTINNYNTDVGEVYNYNSPNLQNYYAYPTINPFGFY